jgi:hypothetical protein
MDSGKSTMFKTAVTGTLVMVLLGMVLVSKASAGCGSSEGPKAGAIQPQSWQGPAQFSPVSVVRVADDEGSDDGIVGFWNVKFVSDGTLIDHGFAQWHPDGTEIMNSARPAASSNFCLGVWKKIGAFRYTVNHFGLSSDPSTDTLIGPAQIREDVVLDPDADTYAGTFTIDQYDLMGNPLAHIEGKVTATRITVNTPVGDVL